MTFNLYLVHNYFKGLRSEKAANIKNDMKFLACYYACVTPTASFTTAFCLNINR